MDQLLKLEGPDGLTPKDFKPKFPNCSGLIIAGFPIVPDCQNLSLMNSLIHQIYRCSFSRKSLFYQDSFNSIGLHSFFTGQDSFILMTLFLFPFTSLALIFRPRRLVFFCFNLSKSLKL